MSLVVLTLQGFMASESMQGNYGFMDMILALQWTQRNIAQFGGNPASVTIFGQSAGAMSVGALLFSPEAQGLFKQGIMESNPLGLPFHSKESAATNANNMNAYLDCPVDDVECMRSKSMDEILDAQKHSQTLNFDTLFENFLPWCPLVEEGGVIPEQPLYALMNGRFTSVPLMSGSTRDEGQLFVYSLFTEPMSEPAYKAVLAATFGRDIYPEVIEMYPYDIVEGSTDGRQAANVLATDLLFYCPLRNATRGYQTVFGNTSSAPVEPSYIYRFEHVLSFDCWEPDTTYCIGYVCHASELPFVFEVFTDGKDLDYDITPAEEKLAYEVSSMWANFAKNGNPNIGAPTPFFPNYLESKGTSRISGAFFLPHIHQFVHGTADEVLFMDEPGLTVQSGFRNEFCDMWDRLGYFY